MRHEVLGHAVIRVIQQYFQRFTRSSPRQVAPDGDAANQAGSGEQVSDLLILAPGTICRCSILTNRRKWPARTGYPVQMADNNAPARELGFATKSLHAGHTPDSASRARAVPIYQTTSFTFENSRPRRGAVRAAAVRQHLHAHHESHHRRVRTARGGARRRHGGAWRRPADRRRSSWRSPACSGRATKWWPPARSTAAPTRSSMSASGAWASTSSSWSRTIRKISARRSRRRRARSTARPSPTRA